MDTKALSLFGFMLHDNNQILQLSELIDEFDDKYPNLIEKLFMEIND